MAVREANGSHMKCWCVISIQSEERLNLIYYLRLFRFGLMLLHSTPPQTTNYAQSYRSWEVGLTTVKMISIFLGIKYFSKVYSELCIH